MSYQQHEIRTPHFAVPFSFGGIKGGVVMHEQGDTDELIDRARVIIAYPTKSRLDLPEFGREDLLFRQISDSHVTARLATALERWGGDEMRAVIDDLTELGLDQFLQRYRINIKAKTR